MQKNVTVEKAPATKGQKIAAVASIAVFFIVLVLLTIFVGGPIIKTLGDPASFREWVVARGFWGRVLFVGVIILQVIVAFIPAEPLELAAGYAFGALWGTILVWLGLVLGTMIVFLFVRKIGVKAVEVFFPREKIDSVKYLNNEKALDATAFILFLIPGTPKDLLTYVAGLTKIRLLPWMLLTSIARIPSIVTSTISGNALGLERYGLAIVVFAATAVVSGLGILLYQRLHNKRMREEAAQNLINQRCRNIRLNRLKMDNQQPTKANRNPYFKPNISSSARASGLFFCDAAALLPEKLHDAFHGENTTVHVTVWPRICDQSLPRNRMKNRNALRSHSAIATVLPCKPTFSGIKYTCIYILRFLVYIHGSIHIIHILIHRNCCLIAGFFMVFHTFTAEYDSCAVEKIIKIKASALLRYANMA
ncbi:MAG: hypothetical protein C0413_01980 [Clostridiales bacterium]|nr:hypothetical protein [Clostridiales bacterium]